jgi:hypothetical protein
LVNWVKLTFSLDEIGAAILGLENSGNLRSFSTLSYSPATGLIVLLTPLAGVLVQRAGPRLYMFLVLALLAIGLSFLYVVVTLNPQSNYSDGLLPAFLIRGLAIPIVTSSITLAVMSAVSTKQSGLASGTLGMARNIGTAFGVALLSQVYLFHVNTAIPAPLATSRAAGQFIVSGKGVSHLVTERIIFQGFGLTALTCLILCAGAVVLILFMRPQVRKRGIITTA